MGDKSFLGPGKTIDTTKKITLVTQFITDTGTSSGNLIEIRRKYVQDGKVYQNSQSQISGVSGNSVRLLRRISCHASSPAPLDHGLVLFCSEDRFR
jgi:hypothetical protein